MVIFVVDFVETSYRAVWTHFAVSVDIARITHEKGF